MTQIAIGCSSSEPDPSANASGSMPSIAASDVISTGRKRRLPDRIRASCRESPEARCSSTASSIRMPFFATMPTTMIIPIIETTFNVERVTNSPASTPTKASTAPATIAMGCANERNSIKSTRNTRVIASPSDCSSSRKLACCCS